MKTSSFGALLYREYTLSKRNALLTIFAIVCVTIICLLISLSMKVGNLARADETMIREVFSNTRLFGIYVSCFIMTISGEPTIKDETCGIWKLFRKSSPASPWMLSLAKFSLIFIFMLISAAFAGIYLLIDSAISASPVAYSDITMLALILAVISLIMILQVICVTFTGSSDKGGLISSIILMGILFFLMGLLKEKVFVDENASFSENWSIITKLSADIFPYVCIAIAAMYIIGVSVTALLYKRREK